MFCSSVAGKFRLAVILCLSSSQLCIYKLQLGPPLYSSGSVAGKFSSAAAVILCVLSGVVPSCMQAAEGAHCIVLTAPLGRAVEQDAMAAGCSEQKLWLRKADKSS